MSAETLPGIKTPPIPKPTKQQIGEVVNPSLSRDFFILGVKEIPIQILPIDDEETLLAIFLPAIKEVVSDLPEKISFKEILAKIDMTTIQKYKSVLIETIFIMAKRADPSISKEFVGQNIHTAAMVKAIMKQFEKNELADMVTNFFFNLAKFIPKGAEKSEIPPSPQS